MKVETLTGPALLFSTLVVLCYKTAPLFGHPLWFAGIGLSMILATVICYWGYQEIHARLRQLDTHYQQQVEKNDALRALFDQAQGVRREKVAQLESMISALEKEQADQQKSYAQLYEQSLAAKTNASAYKCSLEEALDELRRLRQEIYCNQERMGKYPKDLPQKHEQLRAQFEEKSAILDQTRRRLFQNEGYLVVMHKAQEMQRQEPNSEQEALVDQITMLLEENGALEQEIRALEQLVSSPLQKTASKKKGKKALENMLEFQFEQIH